MSQNVYTDNQPPNSANAYSPSLSGTGSQGPTNVGSIQIGAQQPLVGLGVVGAATGGATGQPLQAAPQGEIKKGRFRVTEARDKVIENTGEGSMQPHSTTTTTEGVQRQPSSESLIGSGRATTKSPQ
jgi:hypothetical protein